MSNFIKKNQNVENYFIRKELIVFETYKARFINLPNHNRHIHKALFSNEPKKSKNN